MRINLKDQINSLEKQVDERIKELNYIKIDLKKNQDLVNEQANTISNFTNEKEVLNGIIEKLRQEKVVFF